MGIDVNTKNRSGTPAIITAILYDEYYRDILSDYNQVDASIAPRFAALLNKKLEVIDLLLSKNVDLNIQDETGKTAIDYLNEKPEIVFSQEIKEKFKQFRKRIAEQIYNHLEKFNFPTYCRFNK